MGIPDPDPSGTQVTGPQPLTINPEEQEKNVQPDVGICLFTDVNTPIVFPPRCSHTVAEFSVTYLGQPNA